jgi:hypothetical protein
MKFVSLRPNTIRLLMFFLVTIMPGARTPLFGEPAVQPHDQPGQPDLIKYALDITDLLKKTNCSVQELFNDKSCAHLRVYVDQINNLLTEISAMRIGVAQHHQDQSAQCVHEILSKLHYFVQQLHNVLKRYEHSDNYIALAKELELFVADLVKRNFRGDLESSITTLAALVVQHAPPAADNLKKTAHDLLHGNPLYATVDKWFVIKVLQKRLRK